MTPLSAHYVSMLEKVLVTDFVPHLPPLLDTNKPADQQKKKNLSRAFAGFAISKLCGVSEKEGSQSVVDDFDDYGIDAVYYHAASETLYVVQAKLKASAAFTQEEALAFCQGIRKLVAQDFSGFNQHFMKRRTELEDAVENCSHIELVISHTGSGISEHASKAVADLLAEESHGEERFRSPVKDYHAAQVVKDLQSAQAYPRVDARIALRPWASQQEPRQTYFGFVSLAVLAKLYLKHGMALYVKNLRNPLGHKTDVADEVRKTLATKPEEFVYLNNGVTALCDRIDPKDTGKKAGKHLNLTGISVINGAQTIAAAAHFISQNPDRDISSAQVSITLIKADADPAFSKAVTRARNHQNPVDRANFAALDDEQERLRRDLASLDIHYAYKADDASGGEDPNRIRIEEAAIALALMNPDPRFAVWLKKEPGQLLDTEREPYKTLFPSTLTAFALANAVRLLRYLQARVVAEVAAAHGSEKLVYKHGSFGLGFVLAKRLTKAVNGTDLIDSQKLRTTLSPEFDSLRQTLWNQVQFRVKGPLALFRNQADALPLLRDTMIAHYGLTADPAIPPLRAKVMLGELYPVAIFGYLATKAPQIGNLT